MMTAPPDPIAQDAGPPTEEPGDQPVDQRLAPPPLRSPIPDGVDRAELQRVLSEVFDYDVDIELYERLVTDTTVWDMQDIARVTGAQYQTVSKWRMNTARGTGVRLPPADGMVGQSPWWYAGTIRRLLIKRRWMLPNGESIRPSGPGRRQWSPPRQRTGSPAEDED
jgi:hypothetical protein